MKRFSLFQFVKKRYELNAEQKHSKLSSLHLLVIIGSTIYFIRILVAVYFLGTKHSTLYLAYDQLLGQLYNLGIVDYYLFLAFSPLILFFLYLHCTLYFPIKSDRNLVNCCWRFIYDILVASFSDFSEQNVIHLNWRSAKETQNVKQFFMLKLLQQIGFNCKGEKKRKAMMFLYKDSNLEKDKKNKVLLVDTWLKLEAVVLYLIFNSKFC